MKINESSNRGTTGYYNLGKDNAIRHMEYGGKFSPDTHWIAHISTDTGRAEVYVQSFPGAESLRRTFRFV
jgi:hypothetical protein